MNLTAASLLAPHLSEENVERLVSESKGKSKREVEELLVAFSPKKEFSSSVRREPVRRRESLASGEVSGVSEAGGISEAAMDDWARDGGAEESRRSRPVFEPATPESCRVSTQSPRRDLRRGA